MAAPMIDLGVSYLAVMAFVIGWDYVRELLES